MTSRINSAGHKAQHMDYTIDTLHIRNKPGSTILARASAEQAGWQTMNMVALRLETGKKFGITVDDYEYVAVVLGGVCDIRTSKGNFTDVGRRPDVFTGMPYALYIPPQTEFEIEALTDDFAFASCWTPCKQEHPLRLITPSDVKIDFAGGGNATYQVNTIVGTEFASENLIIRELYTPGGNWSNYPPHQHDTLTKSEDGSIKEAAMDELLFYKIDKPGGFAMQRVYTDDGTIDATMTVGHNDAVIIPKGYHPMVSAQGYTTYALSFMAGQPRSMSHSIHPTMRWLPQTWLAKDPRLPIVSHGMEPLRES
ncbi:MAG: 5-deoxy-glucuronate isomerase [Aggregatilineales bacterium]